MVYPVPAQFEAIQQGLPERLQLKYITEATGSCIRQSSAGVLYEDFPCLYPTLGATYMPWELNYDPVGPRDWLRANTSWFVPVSCVAYFVMIVGGKWYFRDRPAWNCRNWWALWNLSLSVFSLWGFVRTLPPLLHYFFTNEKWTDFYCVDSETTVGNGSTGLWAQWWILSKLPEFIDTFFLIIHKRPIIFLHWFHHVATFGASVYSYCNNYGGFLYIVLNYGVHAVMYFYYCCMALRCKPKWLNPFYITVLQISQFVAVIAYVMGGVIVAHVLKPEGCDTSTTDPRFALLISFVSTAFFVLFMRLFLGRYVVNLFGPKETQRKAESRQQKKKAV